MGDCGASSCGTSSRTVDRGRAEAGVLAPLALAATPCRDIFLFGCCGGIGLEIGAKLVAVKAFDYGSFPAMLSSGAPAGECLPDGGLSAALKQYCGATVQNGCCASVSSLALEASRLPDFARLGVNCLEMEAASVFAAAKKTGLRAAAAFYVSNSVPDKPWREFLSEDEVKRLGAARKNMAADLHSFITRTARLG